MSKMTIDYGTVMVDGIEYKLTGQADFTNRLLDGRFTNYHEVSDGEAYDAEFSASGIDSEGNDVEVYWIFEFVKGNEPEDLSDLNWENADRVIAL